MLALIWSVFHAAFGCSGGHKVVLIQRFRHSVSQQTNLLFEASKLRLK